MSAAEKKLRVLHLLWDGNLGGVQRYVLKVAGAPCWEKCEHGICFFSRAGEVLAEQKLPNARFFSLGLARGWNLFGAAKLDRIVSVFKPDVIHCHCDTPAFSLRIKHFKKCRLLYTEHGDTLMRTERTWFMQRMWAYSGRHWNQILLNSEFVKKDFLRRFPYLSAKCVVLPNPLIETWDGPRTPPGEHEAPRVGVFGRLVPQKGFDWLLEVAGLACARVPGLRVELYGDGPLRAELETKCAAMNLRGRVKFMGFVSDPLARMAQMTCTVVPSRIEPFGLVALEAQGAGVPVVGFLDSGVAEIVIDGVTGFLAPHGDLRAMAGALVALISNRELAVKMGAAAHAHALAHFSLERHVRELERLYRGP